MIDDLKYIHEKDAQDALGIAEKQWQQFEHVFTIADDVTGRTSDGTLFGQDAIENIVFAGMGGSALAAALFQSWPCVNIPFEISRSYVLPNYVNSQTLFIASSYSGNTEETLSALSLAEEKGAMIVVIASGGKLEEIATTKNYPFLKLPGGMQPRFATMYGLKAMLTLFVECHGVIDMTKDQLHNTVVPELAGWLREATTAWLPTIASGSNLAKKIALEMIGKTPVIYAGPVFAPAAYKWKISFNENAKNVAWCGSYPEFNHNEFLGWTSHPIEKPYAVVDLRSNMEHERVQKRFEVSERLLSGKRPAPTIVEAQGDTVAQQLLWFVALGDFVTLYTALLNGLNPTPVDLIEKFKGLLNE